VLGSSGIVVVLGTSGLCPVVGSDMGCRASGGAMGGCSVPCLVVVLSPAKAVQASGSGENSTALILRVVGDITSGSGHIGPAHGLIIRDAGCVASDAEHIGPVRDLVLSVGKEVQDIGD
jgi:hypothetical protein